jgi:hypothetical protein
MADSLIHVRDRAWALRHLHGPGELVLLAEISLFAACVPALMRMPLPRAAGLLERASRLRAHHDVSPERLAELMAVAPAFGRPLVRSGCLTRGVTLFWLLRRRGVDVELRFGLDRDGAADGHCWLVRDGEPYLEKVDPRARFAETFRLPLAAA